MSAMSDETSYYKAFRTHGRAADTETPQDGAGPLSFYGFLVVDWFPLVFGLVSYPTGPILKSAFLWHVSVDRHIPVRFDT